MSFKFDLLEILAQFILSENEKNDLVRLFEFANYLYDDENNLTKTFKLVKDARIQLHQRIKEIFELDILEERDEMEQIRDD